MKLITKISLIIVLVWFLVKGLLIGLEINEKAECMKWLEYSKTYPDFYLLEWQKKQCDNYGIQINSKVVLKKSF